MKKSVPALIYKNRSVILILLTVMGLGIFGSTAERSTGQGGGPVVFAHSKGAATDRLVSFNVNTPGTFLTNIPITGLAANEDIMGVDFRPADGLLYGVATTGTASRLVRINTTTGAVTTVGTGLTPALPINTFYGVDFDSTADRLRVVNFDDLNISINPVTGTVAQTFPNLKFANGDRNFGVNPSIDMIAFSPDRQRPGEGPDGGPILYGINAFTGDLVLIDLNTGDVITIGLLGIQLFHSALFDIYFIGGIPIAVLLVNNQFYFVNLVTGQATLAGNVNPCLLYTSPSPRD